MHCCGKRPQRVVTRMNSQSQGISNSTDNLPMKIFLHYVMFHKLYVPLIGHTWFCRLRKMHFQLYLPLFEEKLALYSQSFTNHDRNISHR